MNKFYKDGVRFECTRCGKCCTCDGYVFINGDDLNNLIEGEKFSKEELLKHYLSSYQGYTVLRDKKNGECIFWDNEIMGCKVYKYRPIQCRTYPFWNVVLKTEERFKKESEFCPGIGKGKLYTEEEIEILRELY